MAQVSGVRHNYPGLLMERLPSGSNRWRVRVEGDPKRRIAIPCGPDDPRFGDHYWAARGGTAYTGPPSKAGPEPRSMQWLVNVYLDQLAAEVSAGLKSASTLKQRRSLLTRLCAMRDQDGDPYGICDMEAPTSAFVAVRNAMTATPAEADNMMKAVRAMYRFACEAKHTATNPAIGVAKIHISRGGATAWTAADLRAFREAHPPGTTAHLWLTLSMFTACRIGDAIWLGRGQEFEWSGMTWLRWQPRKKGSALVEMPMLPPLYRATRAATVQGAAYVLSERGQPFKTTESLRERVRKWCDAAAIPDRSAHGVRKALAELLAEAGCTQQQIMAILAHTKASTSEVYTKGAQRRVLAADAMAAIGGIDW